MDRIDWIVLWILSNPDQRGDNRDQTGQRNGSRRMDSTARRWSGRQVWVRPGRDVGVAPGRHHHHHHPHAHLLVIGTDKNVKQF